MYNSLFFQGGSAQLKKINAHDPEQSNIAIRNTLGSVLCAIKLGMLYMEMIPYHVYIPLEL